LIGKTILFTVDKSGSSNNMSDGSFRVKRICVEPRIIEKLCAEGPFNTPSKVFFFVFVYVIPIIVLHVSC
jgi:hypothetical protein